MVAWMLASSSQVDCLLCSSSPPSCLSSHLTVIRIPGDQKTLNTFSSTLHKK